MKKVLVACVAASMALLSNAVLTAEEASEPEIPSAGAASVVSLTATVEKIDRDDREVTLRDSEGETFTIAVGPEARNLEQLDIGDKVTIEYTQALAVALTPATEGGEERGEVAALERAPEGEKPGGVAARQIDVKATVEAIDTEKREVTLKGPERTLTVAVGEDIDLGKVKVGDQVFASYTEAIAVSVQPAEEEKDK